MRPRAKGPPDRRGGPGRPIIQRPAEGRPVTLAHGRCYEARRKHPVILSPGADNAAADYALRLDDGRTLLTRQPVPPIARVILPGEWEAYERELQEQQRQAEDALLRRAFDEKRLKAAGIL